MLQYQGSFLVPDTGFPDRIFIGFSLLRAYTGLLPEIKPQSLFPAFYPIAV
jgi:hypothetical protein